jgi:cytochrome d ubiquinol oxidase subunit II
MGDPRFWSDASALAALVGIMAYAVLGGADFGGGVWDLLAAGERKKEQRLAVQGAMGPVCEANHVWLILVVVILFTCFPRGYAALGIALFVPFHLALLGIMLRGAAFVFRSHQSRQKEAALRTSTWGVVFGSASIISPILLGIAFGVVTQGGIRVEDGGAVVLQTAPWLSPYCLANGILALSACAYLAAVYLMNETRGELREDFRWRAILAGTSTAALAGLVVVLAWIDARWFFSRLVSVRTLPVIFFGPRVLRGIGVGRFRTPCPAGEGLRRVGNWAVTARLGAGTVSVSGLSRLATGGGCGAGCDAEIRRALTARGSGSDSSIAVGTVAGVQIARVRRCAVLDTSLG